MDGTARAMELRKSSLLCSDYRVVIICNVYFQEKRMTDSSESSRPSRLAILSFVLGILLWLLWCALYFGLGVMAEANSLSEEAGYAGFIFGPIVLGVITLGVGLAGVVVGIQALRRKDPKRGLAIAGLALNFICLCPFILLMAAMLAAGVSSIPQYLNEIMPSFGQ
jgi:hypothetical protein